jgi:protein required for attachment to host cells
VSSWLAVDTGPVAAGVADFLNKQVLSGKIDDIVIIAAPKTLGELRKHYHKNYRLC